MFLPVHRRRNLVLGVVAFRFFSSEIYDMLIVHMTARWYAATFLKLDAGMKIRMWGLAAAALAKNAELVLGKRLVIYGFDYEEAYVKTAQKVVQSAKLSEQVHVQQADVHDEELGSTLGVKDGFFDVVYFSGSISLMPEPHNALLNVAKRIAQARGSHHLYSDIPEQALARHGAGQAIAENS